MTASRSARQAPGPRFVALVIAAVVAAHATACGGGAERGVPAGEAAGPVVRAIRLPDLSRADAAVAATIREKGEAVEREASGTPEARAAAQGALGKVLLAARFYGEAEVALANARALAPRDMQWPYYLGHLHKRSGSLAKSVPFFEEAHRLAPEHVPAMVWLGEAYLTGGDVARADDLFARALAREPRSAAALFGRGRAALQRQDFQAAVSHLEAALAADPQAESVHYPLATAYQGIGDEVRARTHFTLRRRGDIEVPPADPLIEEIDAIVESPVAFELRGIRALDRKDWADAAEQFRRGIAMAPGNASLRHRLGTALFMRGDAKGAVEAFEEALRVDPGFARAHYSLGVLLETGGREAEASGHYAAAVAREPGYAEARSRLARVLRRTGRAKEALAEYERVLEQDPRSGEAAFGYTLTLARLGRHAEARGRLEQDLGRFSERAPFVLVLARLLAAAPADAVRDGGRALALAQELLKEAQTLDVGETLAMALAETGDFGQAIAIQRELVAAARAQGGRPEVVSRLAGNLRLYEQGRPCRQPWLEEPEYVERER
ncbi:MAG: tetratricopeptide repeat protein [Vicinamibacterales bacterium]